MNLSLNKLVITLILASSIFSPLYVRAELIPQENSAEAGQVRILFTKDTEQGIAQVEGCAVCPLRLNIDRQTHFFHNGKEINRNRVESFSGKPGTVIYGLDGKQAHRILW